MSAAEAQRPLIWQRPMRAYLLSLVALAVVPSLAIGAWSALAATRDLQRSFGSLLTETGEAVAVALDRHIEARRVMLLALAESPSFDTATPDATEALARVVTGASRMLGESIAVFQPDGTPVYRTAELDAQEARRPLAASQALRLAVEARRPVVGNLVTEPRWIVPVMVPVVRGERVTAVLYVRLSPEALLQVLSEAKPETASFVTITDPAGRIVARVPQNQNTGQQVPSWVRDVLATRPEGGLTRGTTLAGVRTIAAVKPVRGAPGWAVTVAAPLATYEGLYSRPFTWLAFGGLGVLLLSVVVALILSRHLLRPVRILTREAQRVALGKGGESLAPADPFPVRELEDLRRALQAAEAARRRAQDVQTLLSREVDHRSKNLLAVVQAVLRMSHAETIGDFARVVTGRVQALARIHSLLASSGWKSSDLRVLLESEFAIYAGAGRFALEGPPIQVGPTAVQPLCMIFHELATNAAKHGALSAPKGKVDVTWMIDSPEGMLRLLWRETGEKTLTGSPAHVGFGTRLVNATAVQLGAKARWEWVASGLVFEVRLPLRSLSTEAGKPPREDVLRSAA